MTEAENLGNYPLMAIPVESLHPHPENPRGTDLGDLSDLVESVKAQGIVQPLVAVPYGDKKDLYLIVAGHRRHAAAVKVGLGTVPVVVRSDMPEAQQVEVMLVENVQRADLSPLQVAKSLQRLVGLGLSQRDIAARTGIAQGTVSKRLSLLALGEDIAKAVDTGKIGVHDAEVLAKVVREKGEDGAKVIQAAQKFIEAGADAAKAVERAEADRRRSMKVQGLKGRMKTAGVPEIGQGDVKPSWEGITEKDLPQHVGHAVFYIDYQGDGRFYCKTPKVHVPADEKEAAKAQAAKDKAAREREQAAAKDAVEKRAVAALSLVGSDAATLTEFVTWAVLRQDSLPGGYPDLQFRTEFTTRTSLPIHIEQPGEKESVGPRLVASYEDYEAWLDQHANSAKKIDRLRASAIHMAVRFLYAMTKTVHWDDDEALTEFRVFLEAHDWKPTAHDNRQAKGR